MRRMIRGRRLAALLALASVSAAIALGWIYQVDPAICNGCGICIPHCPAGALYMEGPNAVIDPDRCDGCGDCLPYCIRGAIYACWYEGIGEGVPSAGRMSVDPSPTEGPVLLTGGVPGVRVTVTDLTGREIREAWVDGRGCASFDLLGLPAGPYAVSHGDAPAGFVLLLAPTT